MRKNLLAKKCVRFSQTSHPVRHFSFNIRYSPVNFCILPRPSLKISVFTLTRPYQKEKGRSVGKSLFLPQRRLMNSKIWERAAAWLTKPTKWPVRSAKSQIRLGICLVWSESSLSTWRNLGALATQWVDIKDSDQTGQMPLRWVRRKWNW